MYANSAPTGIEEKVQQALGTKGEDAKKSDWGQKDDKQADEAKLEEATPEAADPKIEEDESEPTIKDEPPNQKVSSATAAQEYDEYN